MRRLDRYVFKEMFVPFLAGTLIVALLFQANSYIFLAKSYNLENIPILARIQWLVYTLPSQLKLTLPTGMALAASLSVGRMGRESEITALRAAGVSVKRLMVPVIFFGLIAGILNYVTVDRLIPESGRKARELAQKNMILGLSKTDKTFKANAFIQIDRYAVSLGTTTRTPRETLMIGDILLIERAESGVKSIIAAPTGEYDGGVWSFHNAVVYAVQGGELLTTETKEISLNQKQDLNAFFAAGSLGIEENYEEMPTDALRVAIDTAKLQKSNPRKFEVELASRYAALVACAIFAFCSAVFSVVFSRSGGFAGLLVSFMVVMAYYNVYVVCLDVLGRQENIPTWVAAWLPNIVFTLLGLAGLRKIE